MEKLEDRTLPAVTFFPQLAYVTPANNVDTALGLAAFGGPIEPNVAIGPNNPANVAISTQGGIEVSTDAGATFSAAVAFADPAGTFGNFGDTWMAFDAPTGSSGPTWREQQRASEAIHLQSLARV